jgi:DNA polymerase I
MYLFVDGTNLAHRAYYALKNTESGIPVTRSGIPIAATQIILRSLLAILQAQPITHVAISFDNDQKTWRHERYSDYKAGRREKDEILIKDLKTVQDLCISSGLGILAPIGHEADDLIASLCRMAAGQPVLISSGDRDLWQLVNENVSVLCPSKGIVTPETVEQILGIKASQILDYKALRGDSSDHIPGVTGIGEKTAIKLLQDYQDIEGIYESIWRITGRAYKALRYSKEDAMLSRQLVTLSQHLEIDQTLEDFAIAKLNRVELSRQLSALDLADLAARYGA